MPFNWNAFSAFNGTLDHTFLQKNPNGLEADIKKFHEWLRGLRNSPELHGIPSKYQEDVKKVFQALSGTDEHYTLDHMPPLLPIFNMVDDEGDRILQPLVVLFGSRNAELTITDGASALGYLFSIVLPPPDVIMFWSDYLMPLLILFSKCLYLAFVKDHTDADFAISGVPVMANVMYLSDEAALDNSSRPFFFGATIPAASHHSPADKQFKNGRGLVTTWRRNQLLLPALRGYEQTLPLLDSTLHDSLGARLDALIRGYPHDSKAIARQPLDDGLHHKTRPVRQRILNRVSLGEDCVVPPNRLLRNRRTRTKLQQLLNRMISHVYSETYDRQNPKVHADYQQLLRFYVAPHIFATATTQLHGPPEVVLVQQEDAIIDELVVSLWKSCSNTALDKLMYLRDMQEKREQPTATTAFGRCAETYPVAAIQPLYFPLMAGQMGNVRGLAMEPRGIGVTSLFNTRNFSSATLKDVPVVKKFRTTNGHGECVCRYPCEKMCRVLLPKFGIPAGLPLPTSYDKDIDEADVGPW